MGLLVTVLALLAVPVRSADSRCPVEGCDPQHYGCMGWRQTGGCDPDGVREPSGDKGCSASISAGASGFCLCGGGGVFSRGRAVTCDHEPLTCEEQCKLRDQYECVMWRQTGGCSADGEREPDQDRPCTALVSAGSSGFCECGGGRRIPRQGCRDDVDVDPFTCQEECSHPPSLYEVLGLDELASQRDIKKAFRQLSLKFHPDKIVVAATETRDQAQKAAKVKFAAIRTAYDALSDAEMRSMYDIKGFAALATGERGKAAKMEKTESASTKIEIDLVDLYTGAELTRHIRRTIVCKNCANAAANHKRCARCKVKCQKEIKIVNVRQGPFNMRRKQEVDSAEKCREVTTPLELDIEAGMPDNAKLNFPLLGTQRPNMLPGDLVVQLSTRRHPVFTRQGHTLKAEVKLTLEQALLGFSVSLTQLDGRTLTVANQGVSWTGQVLVLEGEGMPIHQQASQRGDLRVTLWIDMPAGWTEEQRVLLRKVFN